VGDDSCIVGYVHFIRICCCPIITHVHTDAKQGNTQEAEAKAGKPNAAENPPPAASQLTEDAGNKMELDEPLPAPTQEGGLPKVVGNSEPQPPPPKYRMTETMKAIVWQLVSLSNVCCQLENEK
jgi:hypothetical protein